MESGELNQSLPNAPAKANYSDVLAKYSLDQLHDFLKNRGNKTVYGEPPELREVPSSAMAESVIYRQKSIYGFDRRKDFSDIRDPNILKVSDSVAGMFTLDHLQQNAQGVRIVGPTLASAFNLCTGEAFEDQPVGAYCTAFVVGPDVIATAGHCVNQLANSRVVFGFRKSTNGIVRDIPNSDVYKPIQIVARKEVNDGVDFALIRLERQVTNHAPLALHTDGKIGQGMGVYVVGYPSGLPLKVATDAYVSQVNDNGYFVSNLDTFGGNSGSPVLSFSSNLVEGILVRGDTDYQRTGTCARAFVCPSETGCRGEDSTLISALGTDVNRSQNKDSASPVIKSFDSGPKISGSGASFSGVYTLYSDSPPAGYKIGTYTYSLTGDRACNRWSTCTLAVEGNRVVLRFTLQGHDEWPAPGQASSEGHLIVTYVPSGG